MITIARTLAGAAVVVVGLAGCAYTNGVLPHGGIQPDIYDAVGDIPVEKAVPLPFTITIGGQPFYTGSATDVLKQNASVS